ncbi:cytochrome P450 [Coemansia spiralis]|nr:cytochrome P450 [Coemansia spiralis]
MLPLFLSQWVFDSAILDALPPIHVILSNGLILACGLLIIKIVQRAYLTPLRHIPGPFLSSFTNLPLIYHIARGQYHRYTQALHDRYGDVVRIGYNKVSVSNLVELKQILSTHSFRKGVGYKKIRVLPRSTFSTTNPGFNKTRRRQLGSTYSLSMIRTYENNILEHGAFSLIRSWDACLANGKRKGRSEALVNFYYGFHAIAFDIIGVLGFGKSFDILATGNTRIIDAVHKSLAIGILKGNLPFGDQLQWLFRDMAREREFMISTAQAAITERQSQKSGACKIDGKGCGLDILQHLVDARDPLTGELIDNESLVSEIVLMLIAGTDTSSNTLSWTMLCLLHCPEVYSKLKTQVRSTFDRDSVIRFDDVRSSLPYLVAVVTESMRLHTVVAGFLPRQVPAMGAELMDGRYYLPEGTEVGISLSACHHNKSIWTNPSKFDPERFMGPDREERMRDVLAFSAGVRICLGRYLALTEMYTVLANIILKYNFRLPDFETDCFEEPVGHKRYHSVSDIPDTAFFNCSPKYPQKDCWMVISPAS